MDKNLIKKLLIIGGGFFGVLILFIIIVSITRSISNKKNPYEKIKSNAIVAAEDYYDSLKEKLNSGESIEVTFDELVSKKYMKEYSSKLNDGVKCNGKVVITNNFDNILYTAIMDCGKNYKDETLYDHIINNNEIVTSGDGIYDLYGRYIYRGEKVNNYVEFDGKIWYIVDIEKNKVLGKHIGLMYYTIGQRKGLEVGGTKDKLFVVGKNLDKNILYVCEGEDNDYLFSDSCIVENVNFNCDERPTNMTAKFRYRQEDHAINVQYLDDGNLLVKYDSIKSVTPGQACVFYDGDICLGGGIIKEVRKNGKKLWYLL